MKNIKISFFLVSILCVNAKLWSAEQSVQHASEIVNQLMRNTFAELNNKKRLIPSSQFRNFKNKKENMEIRQDRLGEPAWISPTRSANAHIALAVEVAEYLYDDIQLAYIKEVNSQLQQIIISSEFNNTGVFVSISASTFASVVITDKQKALLKIIKAKKLMLEASRPAKLRNAYSIRNTWFVVSSLSALFTAANYYFRFGQSWISPKYAAMVTGVSVALTWGSMNKVSRLSQSVSNQEARDALIVERGNQK